MRLWLTVAARSAWSRRFVLALIVIAIALSTALLLAIERVRSDTRTQFAQSVSGTDLIVGARSSPLPLLLYAVFHLGEPVANIRAASLGMLSAHPAVSWVVPLSLGDSHRGYPVVATEPAFFTHVRHGDRQPLRLSTGRVFQTQAEAVIGAEVAARLHYAPGQSIVLAHGAGELESDVHDQHPFTVIGVLARTGTPADRSVFITLAGMDAMHAGNFAALPGQARQVTAALVGLHNRAAVFSVQRDIMRYRDEPLSAVMPGVALDELWDLIGYAEAGLRVLSVLVAAVSLAGLVAVILAGLEGRRRELAVLRAAGASPVQVFGLLATEGALITLTGVALGCLLLAACLVLGRGVVMASLGLDLLLRAPEPAEWAWLGAALLAGWTASLLPALRAYQLSLADGLQAHA